MFRLGPGAERESLSHKSLCAAVRRSVSLRVSTLLLAATIACADDPVRPAPPVNTTLKFTIDGHEYSAFNSVLGPTIGNISANGNAFVLYGVSFVNGRDDASIHIRIGQFHGVGTYVLGEFRQDSSFGGFSLGTIVVPPTIVHYETRGSQSGTVQVSAYDAKRHTIAGTFELSGVPEGAPNDSAKLVTNGVFSGLLGNGFDIFLSQITAQSSHTPPPAHRLTSCARRNPKCA